MSQNNANCSQKNCKIYYHWNCKDNNNNDNGNNNNNNNNNNGNDTVIKPDQPDTDKPDTNKPDNDQNNDQNNDQSGGNNNNQGSDNENNTTIGTYAQQVANIVNQERAKNGLSALKVNTKLSSVATKKAEDMRDNNYFSHTSPTYGSPFEMMKQFGISYTAAGENIAEGQKTPQSVMNAWMNSEGHRANILNANFTEIGVGYVTDSKGNTYWVQMFIRP